MITKNIKTYFLALLAFAVVILASCDEDEVLTEQRLAESPAPSAPSGSPGNLNLNTYVSLGNSLTAGFMDNALYTDGQNQSFPNLLAQQFQIMGVGGGDFGQPDINSANGFSGNSPDGPLGRFVLNLTTQRPEPTQGEVPQAFAGDRSTIRNFGVPGMRLVDIDDPSLAARNGLYARFAANPGVNSVLDDAMATSPTFFTYWLGNNDILGYAIGGGSDESLITGAAAFQASLQASLGRLTSGGARGAVLGMPPIVVIPFFRAVPFNSITLDAATAGALNAGFAGFNAALQGLNQARMGGVPGISTTEADINIRSVNYAAGNNPILMVDDALLDYDRPGGEFDILLAIGAITLEQRAALAPLGQARPATENDLPTLLAATQLGTPVDGDATRLIGVSVPAPDNLILSASEVVTTVTARATFNAIIEGTVAGINAQAANTLTFVDVQPAFADLFGLTGPAAAALALSQDAQDAADGQLGLEVNGVTLAPDFGPNGVFSTDGVHPNPRGHAIVANLIISALNSTYGASIPPVNVLNLRGVITITTE